MRPLYAPKIEQTAILLDKQLVIYWRFSSPDVEPMPFKSGLSAQTAEELRLRQDASDVMAGT